MTIKKILLRLLLVPTVLLSIIAMCGISIIGLIGYIPYWIITGKQLSWFDDSGPWHIPFAPVKLITNELEK